MSRGRNVRGGNGNGGAQSANSKQSRPGFEPGSPGSGTDALPTGPTGLVIGGVIFAQQGLCKGYEYKGLVYACVGGYVSVLKRFLKVKSALERFLKTLKRS